MRRRFQQGSLVLSGRNVRIWTARWVEDELLPGGAVHRRHRSQVLGTQAELPSKRDARRAFEPILNRVNSTTYKPKYKTTFSEFSETWKKQILPNHKPSYQKTTLSYLKRLTESFGPLELSELGTEQIQRWISSQHDLAPKTIRNLVGTLSAMLASARAWNYVSGNPLDGLILPKRGLVEKPCLTPEQARVIIQRLPEPYKTMVWIIAETGIRGGEACGLFVDDVDFARNMVHVRRSAWCGQLQTPKTGNAVRSFAVSPQLAGHIKEFLSLPESLPRRSGRTEAGSFPPLTSGASSGQRTTLACGFSGNLLFCTEADKPLDNYEVTARILKPALRELGWDGPRVGLHSFRHGNASALDSLGCPMKVRQERLGHSSSEMTMSYTHSVSADHRNVAEQLGQLFCPPPKEKPHE